MIIDKITYDYICDSWQGTYSPKGRESVFVVHDDDIHIMEGAHFVYIDRKDVESITVHEEGDQDTLKFSVLLKVNDRRENGYKLISFFELEDNPAEFQLKGVYSFLNDIAKKFRLCIYHKLNHLSG